MSKLGPLLPNGWGKGFAIGAGGARGVFETQLKRDGFVEVFEAHNPGLLDFLPWLASVGKRLFAPPWFIAVRESCITLLNDGALRAKLVAYLKNGNADQRARALLAAIDLGEANHDLDARVVTPLARIGRAVAWMEAHEEYEDTEASDVRGGGP